MVPLHSLFLWLIQVCAPVLDWETSDLLIIHPVLRQSSRFYSVLPPDLSCSADGGLPA